MIFHCNSLADIHIATEGSNANGFRESEAIELRNWLQVSIVFRPMI
ncbi:hypothetical protein [Phormidium sp. CCY1219]|nr:hypothetical protein [Phormidium sp. CCY1219]MEB3827654.1 hypothetical protein [Phormidium sp. CCY1219]